ncbi:MAG TPA: hypothetical protein VHI13_18870 [Candidatus Kapabacteria bacterium]|nr:hypothetical protein [Candidatus Kapabacteria bacterium]
MNEPWRGRRLRLWLLTVVAIAYAAAIRILFTLTGSSLLDGIVGMLLGLFVSAQPAANMLTLLFYDRAARRQTLSTGAGTLWLVLNIVVLLVGATLVALGATLLAQQAFHNGPAPGME